MRISGSHECVAHGYGECSKAATVCAIVVASGAKDKLDAAKAQLLELWSPFGEEPSIPRMAQYPL